MFSEEDFITQLAVASTCAIQALDSTGPPLITAHLLAKQLQHLHLQLPPMTFNSNVDTPSFRLPDASVYLDHYDLQRLTAGRQMQHFIGTLNCLAYNIAVQYWLPPMSTGTVFVVHGYFDHAGLYGHLIEYLLNRNLAVVAFDLPGHGLSDGEQVSIASFDHYVEVFDAILVRAEAHLPKPWHSVGQSTGGAIILKHLLQEPADRHLFADIAILAPLLRPRHWQGNRLVYMLIHRFMSRMTRKFQANSGDAAFLEFLANKDPLQARHIPLLWIGAMKRWTEEFHALPVSAHPVHIIQGDQDTTLDWRYNLKQFRHKLPNANIHIINGARHHMVNECAPLRSQVFAAMGFETAPRVDLPG